MRSSAAEVARTVAVGRLPGRVKLAGRPIVGEEEGLEISHATSADGVVLFAARRGSRAWAALAEGARAVETALTEPGGAELTVDDVPPFADAPAYPSVHLRGVLARVTPAEERGAVLAFAEANPIGDLLDVGRPEGGEHNRADVVDLFRLTPRRVWLQKCHATAEVALDEFAAATPDPLRTEERDLLTDLREHHAAQLAALVPGNRVPERAQVRPVRVDRYGVLLALPELARVEFAHPATDADCVARALGLH